MLLSLLLRHYYAITPPAADFLAMRCHDFADCRLFSLLPCDFHACRYCRYTIAAAIAAADAALLAAAMMLLPPCRRFSLTFVSRR